MVDILMAVYNGERYLKEQLDSIFSQTYKDWRLLIIDDASTDNTKQILFEYRDKYPDKIELFFNNENQKAPQKVFFKLIQDSSAEYIATCDHDDVWLPDKLELTLGKMKELEEKWGTDFPLLVHTDLKVVDEKLDVISPSMLKSQKLNSNAQSMRDFMVQNHVTGCTMMINRQLANIVKRLPDEALMHDWWFALVASAFGAIGFVDKPTILYRQHGGNQVGAKSVSQMSFLAKRIADKTATKLAMDKTYLQAAAFLKEYKKELSPRQRDMLLKYANIPKQNKFGRLWTLCSQNYFKYGFVRKIGQFLYI